MPQVYPDQPGDFGTMRRALGTLAQGRLNYFKVAELANVKAPEFSICVASDGRDIGEGAGSGTGCIVMRKADGQWYRLDNSVVEA